MSVLNDAQAMIIGQVKDELNKVDPAAWRLYVTGPGATGQESWLESNNGDIIKVESRCAFNGPVFVFTSFIRPDLDRFSLDIEGPFSAEVPATDKPMQIAYAIARRILPGYRIRRNELAERLRAANSPAERRATLRQRLASAFFDKIVGRLAVPEIETLFAQQDGTDRTITLIFDSGATVDEDRVSVRFNELLADQAEELLRLARRLYNV